MRKAEIRKTAYELFLQGYSLRQIQTILNKVGIKAHFSTIKYWIDMEIQIQKEKAIQIPEELRQKIRELLMFKNKEKGKSRFLSFRQIYKLLEVDLQMIGITSYQSWNRIVKDFINQEWGSYEGLQKKRLDKRETSKNIVSKGKLSREAGTWEIDATGYSYNGKHYHIFIARERWSGCFLDAFYKEVKEDTNTQYYNRAFSTLDIALYLMSLFEKYGLPEKIITDNEAILKTELIMKGLEKLNIKHRNTIPGRPNQKLIERSFRDLKDKLRYYTQTHQNFESALKTAIEMYNREEHKFEHFNEPVIPEILHQTIIYRQANIDDIRLAFRERHVRTVRNNSITIDNLVYEFFMPVERYGEYGRKAKAPTVICYRDLEDATKLEVWDEKEQERLGYAQLISKDVPSIETIDIKEQKNKEKRISKRKAKLAEEMEKIRQEEIRENADDFDVFKLFPPKEEIKREETKQEDEFDVFKLFANKEEIERIKQKLAKQEEEEKIDIFKLFGGS
jgi:transposase-like protein